MHADFPKRSAEGALLVVFLAWTAWLPLPFGSVIEKARLPLIVVPLLLCALSSLAAFRWDGFSDAPAAWRIWTIGSLAFLFVVAMQLVPLPPALLRALSPRSSEIWTGSDRVSALLGLPVARWHPISVDPAATLREWFRLLALFASFQTAALLFRTQRRRVAFAITLVAAAVFQILYGVNEAALRRYAIWGWKNRLIYDRVTGTFVNPNHYANYLAIVLPVALCISAWAWHRSSVGAPLGVRVARLVEKHALPFGVGMLGALGCLAGILVAQSRGALLASFCSAAVMTIIAMARSYAFRSSRKRRVLVALAGVTASAVVLSTLIVYLGRERTIKRFTPSEGETVTLVGRTVGAKIAFGVWRQFPILGSGAGTFVRVSSMVQTENLPNLFDHAHDDYLEVAATTGTIGFLIAIVTLFAGYRALVRVTFGDEADGSFRRRAFQAAALTSITIAMVHALFDFNFFIPANPATLAAIAGVAVAPYIRSFDPDSTADRIARHGIRQPDIDPMDSA